MNLFRFKIGIVITKFVAGIAGTIYLLILDWKIALCVLAMVWAEKEVDFP